MAVIKPEVVSGDDRYTTAMWEAVTETDSFAACGLGKLPDKTMQVFGTFDGASIALHGSVDDTNYAPLTTNGVDPIAITAAGFAWIWENPRFIKPVATGGGATQSVTVIVGGSNLT